MVEINDELKKLIENNPLAFATVYEDNPNVIAIAYVRVVSKNQVLITDNYMKQTKENLMKNKNVCIAAWDKKWNGYKLIGKAEYFTSGKWYEMVKKIPGNRGEPCKGAILVTINKIKKLG